MPDKHFEAPSPSTQRPVAPFIPESRLKSRSDGRCDPNLAPDSSGWGDQIHKKNAAKDDKQQIHLRFTLSVHLTPLPKPRTCYPPARTNIKLIVEVPTAWQTPLLSTSCVLRTNSVRPAVCILHTRGDSCSLVGIAIYNLPKRRPDVARY